MSMKNLENKIKNQEETINSLKENIKFLQEMVSFQNETIKTLLHKAPDNPVTQLPLNSITPEISEVPKIKSTSEHNHSVINPMSTFRRRTML